MLPEKFSCIDPSHAHPKDICFQSDQFRVQVPQQNIDWPSTRLGLELKIMIVIAKLQAGGVRFVATMRPILRRGTLTSNRRNCMTLLGH
jgi:hypothetical protein